MAVNLRGKKIKLLDWDDASTIELDNFGVDNLTLITAYSL